MDRAGWMAGRWGLMFHFLPPNLWTRAGAPVGAGPDAAADGFDLPRFLDAFEATGASWFVFTLGQNTGLYTSPNAVIDRYAGPGHTPRRDLAGEIAAALHARGKRFVAYLPSEIRANAALHQGFAWDAAHAPRQDVFQARWLEAVRAWAERWGPDLDGWWFDGCYAKEGFIQPYMRWDEWFAAARAGNPDAAVTFNDGAYCGGFEGPIRPEFDYLAGETSYLHRGKIPLASDADRLMLPAAEYAPGTRCRTHVLAPIDCFWAHNGYDEAFASWLGAANPFRRADPARPDAMEPPYLADDELGSFVAAVTGAGGGVTLNVGCYADGSMGDATRAQLERVLGGRR